MNIHIFHVTHNDLCLAAAGHETSLENLSSSVFRIYLEIILELFFFHFADCCRQTMRLRIEHSKIPEFRVCYVCFKISTRPIKIKWIKGVPIMMEFLRLVYSLRFWKKNVHEALIWTFTAGRHHYNLLWVCLLALFWFFSCLRIFWRLFYLINPT